MLTLFKLAFRDLNRNRRRSTLTLIAVALGLALLIAMNGLIEGEVAGALENTIRLQTGHVQVRAESYDEDKISLKWEDLLNDASSLATRAQALPGVQAATPILWASGILGSRDETTGVRVLGIDPQSAAYAPIKGSLVVGSFLASDDRSGILIGEKLAKSLGLSAGSQVSLLVNTSNEQPDEALFTIRGLFNTNTPTYDETSVFMPITKAQAFTRTEGRASAIFILLHQQEDADRVAFALRGPSLITLTYRELNQVLLQTVEASYGIMNLLYLMVLAVVAVVIANTLLMSVFERTREMGILASLGMKGRQILTMFLMEAGALAIAGIIVGIIFGSLGVLYFATVGYSIGEEAELAGAAIAFSSTIYARFSPLGTLGLSIAALVITLLASLYPAWHAARLEPIDALRSAQ
ncbi:MAG: ABC transporter permease [Chloroflexi bacterium]|nr:ABC transporter permease [Chloroflexota bacterium]